jgi:sugar O-acyltransferase (sialic acid O-acetyltransferase NeuD family)
MRVIIIGAGGHAQVVADILLRAQEQNVFVQPIGFLDDHPALAGQHILGLPVMGVLAQLQAIPHEAVVIAIGDNATRQRLYADLQSRGECFAIARHPRAVIAPDVFIGPGSMIAANVVVNTGSVISANAILNTGSTVDHHNHIGAHAHIAPGAHLGGHVTVGDGVLVGIGATVMPGQRVGAWSVVGAGTLVHRDVPEKVTAVGVPARILKQQRQAKEMSR